ncbi:putative competence-damage inducible protein [Rubripirellula tenax]|uniref:Putative competence-damage inducible protein n=1 Tax=Rubripirellula tenax TaxID=2528015 RepID=A0A5C6EJ53_9BACT|nr:nicotinamide-nucleotide amidohydrolase family protein [Rubripirellula tenax]TWU48838.1 putative competence-damage inducible protein [Rubripirellula tenax]
MTLAADVVARLAETKCRVVFAESCTCGMVACELGKIAGVSQWLCGSAVTYRDATKTQWLDVDADTIQTRTAVCDTVAHQMATGALGRTPESDLAVAITGHLGPDAPQGYDGLVFIGFARRKHDGAVHCEVHSHTLKRRGRGPRQVEATELVFQTLLASL